MIPEFNVFSNLLELQKIYDKFKDDAIDITEELIDEKKKLKKGERWIKIKNHKILVDKNGRIIDGKISKK